MENVHPAEREIRMAEQVFVAQRDLANGHSITLEAFCQSLVELELMSKREMDAKVR
jgi:hypothetical protein